MADKPIQGFELKRIVDRDIENHISQESESLSRAFESMFGIKPIIIGYKPRYTIGIGYQNSIMFQVEGFHDNVFLYRAFKEHSNAPKLQAIIYPKKIGFWNRVFGNKPSPRSKNIYNPRDVDGLIDTEIPLSEIYEQRETVSGATTDEGVTIL